MHTKNKQENKPVLHHPTHITIFIMFAYSSNVGKLCCADEKLKHLFGVPSK